MNIKPHHLELFYYVARHQGLSRASRKMPYGVHPSAISRQLCEFEREIGVSLFERQSFQLTPVGDRLYALIKPVFANLPELIRRWRDEITMPVSLAASPVVLSDYLPPILKSLKERFPQLRLTAQQGSQKQIMEWLHDQAVDLAITVDGDVPAGYCREILTQLPLVLLAPDQVKLRSANELWALREITQTLVGFPAEHPVSRCFSRGLQRYGKRWPATMEANSLELVEAYVRQGFGFGLSIALPGRPAGENGLRALPLMGFPKVPVAVIWKRDPSEAAQGLIAELRRITTANRPQSRKPIKSAPKAELR